MASGVFGTPITLDTVRATGLYPEPITQRNCAEYAEKMMNAGGKDTEALKYVDNLKSEYGDGISAKCLIYNATGTTLQYVDNEDWHGNIYGTPYPSTIMNGQWGAFLHVHPTLGFGVGSAGAVIYRSFWLDDDQNSCDWLSSWSIPYVGGSNRVHTEIREPDHFPKHWDYLYHMKLENSGRHAVDRNYGYYSDTMIAEGTTALVRTVFRISP